MVLGSAAGELRPLGGAHAVAGDVLGLDAQFLHLLDHRPALRVHSAIHDDVRALGLDLGENRLEVRCLVVGVLACNDGRAGSLGRLFRFVGEPRTVRRLVINDRNLLGAESLDRGLSDHAALLNIVGHHAKRRLEALQCELRIRRRRRNLRYAGVAVELGRRNRGPRVQVTDNPCNLVVDHLLRNDGPLLGIGLIVLRVELELHLLAIDDDVLAVGVVDRETGSVLVVLAKMRLGAGGRASMSNLHRDFSHRRGRSCSRGLGLFRWFFLATSVSGHKRGRDQRQTERAVDFHEYPPKRDDVMKKGGKKQSIIVCGPGDVNWRIESSRGAFAASRASSPQSLGLWPLSAVLSLRPCREAPPRPKLATG